MTKYELHDDYRTTSENALSLLGLNRNDIDNATNFHELFAHMTPGRKQIALASVEVYKMFCYREHSEKLLMSQDIYNLMKPVLTDLSVEECWVIMVNQAQRVIKKVRISIGGIASTLVDVRVVLKEAILSSATGIVLVHNHPSGHIRPSREDDKLTDRMNKACELMDIRFLDHVIFADSAYYSYCDEGRI